MAPEADERRVGLLQVCTKEKSQAANEWMRTCQLVDVDVQRAAELLECQLHPSHNRNQRGRETQKEEGRRGVGLKHDSLENSQPQAAPFSTHLDYQQG